MSIRTFVGTKKAMKAKKRIELILKVIASPIWIPLWLLTMLCYFIVSFFENYVFSWLEYVSDRFSIYIANKFFK